MKIGNYNLYSIYSGIIRIDGGSMFGVIPKNLWNNTNPADKENRIELVTRNLLIVNKERKVLVDVGTGDKYSGKFAKIFNLNNSLDTLFDSLRKFELTPEDITDVIITHLHFDHAGASTRRYENKILPTFPNAKYYVQKKHFEWALNPTERDKASFFQEDFLPVFENKQFVLVEGRVELFPGIEVLNVSGHTPAQQIVRVFDDKMELYYCADLIPLVSQVRLPYIMGFDLQPLITIEEKREILEKAFINKSVLFFEHDPIVECATIEKDEKGYRVEKTMKLDEIE